MKPLFSILVLQIVTKGPTKGLRPERVVESRLKRVMDKLKYFLTSALSMDYRWSDFCT